MAAAQKGTIVKGSDGRVLDARDVKNGSGGKRGHRVKNNRLSLDDSRGSGAKGGDVATFDTQMEEAVKKSLEEATLKNEREKERKELDVTQRQWVSKLEKDVELKKNKRKEKNDNEIFELDISDDDEKKNKNVGKAISIDMFERVDKKLKTKHSCGIRGLSKITNREEKEVKKNDLKKLKKTLKQLSDDKKNEEHINLIERMTSDGDDLMSPNKINSQNVMDMILQEHELDEDSE